MAITITDNQNVIDAADATTGWGGGSPAAYAGFQREGSNCLGDQVGNGYSDQWFTIASTDYSNRTIFGWCRSGNPHLEANDGFGIILGSNSAVNQVSYTVGGSDNWGHFVSGWGGFRLDTANLPTGQRSLAGAAPTLTALTEIGYSMGYNSKANGNADNVFWDQLKWIANGSAALSFSGGSSGVPAVFADITAADIASTSGAAYGILRELVGAKAYEMFYGCEWGHATGNTYFDDADFQLFINGGGSGDAGMTAGNMDMSLLAGTGTNLFKWDNFVCIGVGTVANWDFSALFETFELTNGSFTDAGTFTLPVTGGTSRKLENMTFINCGQVNASTCPITALVFNGTTDANGAILANRDMTGHTFNSDGTGHAIYITTPGTYAYDANAFVGYGANTTTDAVIYNNSGGLVTINVNGGHTPTYRDGASATTSIVSAAPVTITVLDDTTGSPIATNARVMILNATTKAEITSGTANGSGVFSYSFTGATPQAIVGWVREMSLTGTDYVQKEFSGTIESTGFSLTVRLTPIV